MKTKLALLALFAFSTLAYCQSATNVRKSADTATINALIGDLVLPSGGKITIASGATLEALAGSTLTGFGGSDLASPGPIGGTTPSTGAFTTMTATNSALGATTAQAVSLINSTAAANGAQQVSPALLWQGKGWGTTAGTSQTIAMRTSLTPVQDTTPSTKLVTQYNINNAGWNDLLTLDSSGSMLFNGTTIGTAPGNNMYSLAAGSFYILGHSGAWKVALESDTLYSWTDKAVGLGNSTHGWKELWVGGILIATGTGTPEGAVTAPVGSLYTNQSNGDVYRKTSGTGNTGWVTP